MNVLESNGTIRECNADDLEVLRHTASHILAQAVKRLYPGTKLAIGPAIRDGFYYDLETEEPLQPEDLKKIEAEMKKIVKEKLPLECFSMSREAALAWAREQGEPYKQELIEDLPEDEAITFFRQGEFTDLCAGPHVENTRYVKSFKLMSLAGAYWRGDEHNKMLTRIYGTAFFSKEELKDHLNRLEEAKKRDHRRLGQELELFTFKEEGAGFPFFLPKGVTLKNLLMQYWRDLHIREGYEEISTPIMLNRKLWEVSGHWDHYRDNMYTCTIDEEEHAIKPMNCPGCMLIYKNRKHSYRELPIRYGEFGIVHRHEKSGALHGLMRVRSFTQDDAHIFMTEEQIVPEIRGVIRLIDEVYSRFGFKYHVELSTRPEDSMGSDAEWNMAEQGLRTALEEAGLDYIVNEGDGAFYGPKIDFHLEDSIGRTWQCGTIQLDFQLPQRFDAVYTAADGKEHRPIMIHRVVYGSIERFIGILTEHYAGKFPFWLAPVQVKLLPISEKFNDYAREVQQQLRQQGLRTELDQRDERIGNKIRVARLERVPYMLILGEKELEEGRITVRSRDTGEQQSMELTEFVRIVTD